MTKIRYKKTNGKVCKIGYSNPKGKMAKIGNSIIVVFNFKSEKWPSTWPKQKFLLLFILSNYTQFWPIENLKEKWSKQEIVTLREKQSKSRSKNLKGEVIKI